MLRKKFCVLSIFCFFKQNFERKKSSRAIKKQKYVRRTKCFTPRVNKVLNLQNSEIRAKQKWKFCRNF